MSEPPMNTIRHFSHDQQLRKIAFYTRGFLEHFLLPPCISRAKLNSWLKRINRYDPEAIWRRVNYYNRLETPFEPAADATSIAKIPWGKTTYRIDFRRVMRHFYPELKANYRFGDVTEVTDRPRFVKTRPITRPNANNILLHLNSIRHFRPIYDPLQFRQKKDSVVWRGAVKLNHRSTIFRQHFGNPQIDIGVTKARPISELEAWRKPYLSIAEQLQHKFVLSVEGNDVATNLKWIAQSNSLCFMPKPKFESWFMEGTLEAGTHYVEVKDDYSDLLEKMDYYCENPDEAEAIIDQLKRHHEEFTDSTKEHLISLLVARKYFQLSGQLA